MYNKIKTQRKTTLSVNKSVEGETIEQKIHRIVNNKEPIKDGAPLVYTDRSEGIRADMDIRTDRWDIAVDAMDKVAKTHVAKREERAKLKAIKGDDKPKDEGKPGEPEGQSTQGTK